MVSEAEPSADSAGPSTPLRASGESQPAAPPKGLHPLASIAVFIPLWQFVTGIAAGVPIGIWLFIHREELLTALRHLPPQQAVTSLFAGQGDLLMLASAAAAAPVYGLIVFFRRVLDKKPVIDLGLAWNPRHLAIGFGAGALTVLGIFGTLLVTGQLRVAGLTPGFDAAAAVKLVGLLGLVFLQSGTEELVCRGYLFHTTMGFVRPWVAVVLVSLFFGALHLLNPDASAMSFLQTTLIGVLFSQVCLKTGGLWVAVGLHTAWNFTLGTIASLPVSGMRMSRLLEVADIGRPWLTGGAYGPEASVLTLVVVSAACVAMAAWSRRPRLR